MLLAKNTFKTKRSWKFKRLKRCGAMGPPSLGCSSASPIIFRDVDRSLGQCQNQNRQLRERGQKLRNTRPVHWRGSRARRTYSTVQSGQFLHPLKNRSSELESNCSSNRGYRWVIDPHRAFESLSSEHLHRQHFFVTLYVQDSDFWSVSLSSSRVLSNFHPIIHIDILVKWDCGTCKSVARNSLVRHGNHGMFDSFTMLPILTFKRHAILQLAPFMSSPVRNLLSKVGVPRAHHCRSFEGAHGADMLWLQSFKAVVIWNECHFSWRMNSWTGVWPCFLLGWVLETEIVLVRELVCGSNRKLILAICLGWLNLCVLLVVVTLQSLVRALFGEKWYLFFHRANC